MKLDAKHYSSRYTRTSATTNDGNGRQTATTETAQELLAYLYTVIRHDAAMVQVMDKALKARYGNADGYATTTSAAA